MECGCIHRGFRDNRTELILEMGTGMPKKPYCLRANCHCHIQAGLAYRNSTLIYKTEMI